MSLFLLEPEEADRLLAPLLSARKAPSGNPPSPLRTLSDQLLKPREWVSLSSLSTCTLRKYLFRLPLSGCPLRLVCQVDFQRQLEVTRLHLDVVTGEDHYYAIATRYSIMQICRNITYRSPPELQHGVSLAVDVTTGRVRLRLPVLPRPEGGLKGFLETRKREGFWNSFERWLMKLKPVMEGKLEALIGHEEKGGEDEKEGKVRDSLLRFSRMVMVSSHLSDNYIESERETCLRQTLREKSIKRLLEGQTAPSPALLKSCLLFTRTPRLPRFDSEREFQLSSDQSKQMRAMIAMPVQPKPKNPYENGMVLNHIFIDEPERVAVGRVGEGGFATIGVAEISYWYVYSSQGHELMSLGQQPEKKTARNRLTKWMAVKKEKEVFDRWDYLRQPQSRNAHELLILKRMKNGASIFFPKYYLPTNKPNPFCGHLLLDFIPFATLADFLAANRPLLSLPSLTYLAFSLTQALRYLRDYRIVHLDLKPTNIMLYCNMLLKLVDFGESYHPDLDDTHKPGFTLPYSCPELFHDAPITAKSDVFSLGVVCYEMLFGRKPYDIHPTHTQVDIAMLSYLSRWHYSPESELCAAPTVLAVLMGVISRCLSPLPEDRPELDWIALILRHCCQLLQ